MLSPAANMPHEALSYERLAMLPRMHERPESAKFLLLYTIDLIPSFGTKLSMISSKERGRVYVEEQAHGGADDRGAQTVGGWA